MKNSKKSALALTMSVLALAIFAMLAPQVASALTACSSDQWGACGTFCADNLGKNYSCCGTGDTYGVCDCYSDPVDCSPYFN